MPSSNPNRFCMCPTPDTLSETAKQAMSGKKAALLNEYRWPAASVIKVKFLSGSPPLQAKVRDAALLWTGPGLANLTLDFVPSGPAEIRVSFVEGDGSWSYIGTDCQRFPEPQATMNFGWLHDGSSDDEIRSVVLHEFGHALGLIHEHQNPNRPIDWNKPAVYRDLSGPPNNWDKRTIDHNMFAKYEPGAVTATPVDAKSIMMYMIPAAWTNDGFSAGLNEDLSPDDKRLINQAYT